jgi:hypothetical protein
VIRRIRPAAVERLTRTARDADLAGRGADGGWAGALDRRAEEVLAGIVSLSELTTFLALGYLERIRRPWPALTLPLGARLVTRSYAAHLAVEDDPRRFGATDVPVLGNLPEARNGRPPQDLLTRVVKASRRQFKLICAVSPETWDGFVTCCTYRVHEEAAGAPKADDGEETIDPWLDPGLVDGLSRFGWVLRQVDLFYGQQPERI